MDNNALNKAGIELLNYVKSLNLIDSEKISMNTFLEKDLGLTGDDAVDFIENFASNFNVDITSFNYRKYFGDEGVNIMDVLSRLIFKKKKDNHLDLSLKKLSEAIVKGRLE